MKRRPLQLSMLSLLGVGPEKRLPFEGSIITSLSYDQDGNVTSVTVEGAGYVEEQRLAPEATKVVAQAPGGAPVDQSTPKVALERDTPYSRAQRRKGG